MTANDRGNVLIEFAGCLVFFAIALPPIFVAITAYSSKLWLEHRFYQGLVKTLTAEDPKKITHKIKKRIDREMPWGRMNRIYFTSSMGKQKWKTSYGQIDWCFRFMSKKCFPIRIESQLKEQRFLR